MDWTRGPPVLVGEKVFWSKNSHTKPKSGVIKWMGQISEISSDWCVGIELDEIFPNVGGDGFWKGRKLFECRPSHGLLVPVEEIQKLGSKTNSRPISADNYSHFDEQEDFTRSSLQDTKNKKKQLQKKNNLELRQIKVYPNNQTSDSDTDKEKENRKFDSNNSPNVLKKNHYRPRKNIERRNSKEPEKNSSRQSISILNPKTLKNSQTLDSRISVNEFIKNMNEIAGYFKEIKEGDETFEKQERSGSTITTPNDSNDSGPSKPKKLFSFLKWFNKKHKNEPNLKLFKDSSVASSPIFPRKETSSCESIDTIFSTQTVRSFAYIPPTQYMPSAPPLDSPEKITGNFPLKKTTQEDIEPIYDRRKKRKAPEPPRLSRENSLPTTLEFKKTEENFDGIKTFHRRTVSESFKDKKAGAYCHVQGKRKAPPPPPPFIYPNLQKINNQYPSLYKKKKPAPPPPELNQNQETVKDVKKQDTNQPVEEPKRKKSKDLNDIENEEKGAKINKKPKDGLIKDVSLSPLPSRPWYKRNNRDSSGNNIIKKDFLRGFDKKANKESDDWMPEVGFPKRTPSIESSHSKFNIFSKLDKTEEKKKEEKRKSQISILTNISELDREAAEIVKKEQAQEKKMKADNDARYYSSKENDDNNFSINEKFTNISENYNKGKNKSRSETETQIDQVQPTYCNIKDVNTVNNEDPKIKKGKETEAKEQSQNNPKPDLLSADSGAKTSSSSSQTNISKSSQQARLNYFNVQNKETNYLNEPWVCQKCTLENPGWRVFCEICRSVKPMFSVISSPKTPELQKKDDKKETNKLEPVSEETDKSKGQESFNHTKSEKLENTENKATETESLDELRKKRMMFFTAKLDTLDESDSNKAKLKKILKEMKDSFSEEEHEKKTPEEDADKRPQKEKLKEDADKRPQKEKLKEDADKRPQKEKLKEDADKRPQKEKSKEDEDRKPQKEKPKKENETDVTKPQENAGVREEENIQEEPQKSNFEKKKETEKALIPTCHNNNNASEIKQVFRNQSPPNKSEEIAEAYIVTKTVVLEDIIIKKPESTRKTVVQAKPVVFNSSETKALRPPPRTKKTSSGSLTESNYNLKMGGDYRPEDLEELTTRLTQAEGLADFRADIETMPLNTEMNTVAVNRLLRKLETAINCGDHFVAAGLAKELALMKINCSVTRQVTPSPSTSTITADLYIEDKVSHQGPIALKVSPSMSLLQLKKKVQQEFGIPLEVQRWILDKKLATDDNKTLEAEGVRSDFCPLFLYLVAPGNRKTNQEVPPKSEKNSETQLHQNSQQNEKKPKTKGWYYNYEEDHYSYCEDSEDDSKNSGVESKPVSSKEDKPTTSAETDFKTARTNQKINKEEKIPVFDLKIKDGENNPEKELKFISANSVRQKVEQLNRTFAENAKAIKPPLRSSRSPETWKCSACNVVNLSERLNCSSCSAKKAPKNTKTEALKEPTKKDSVSKEDGNDNVHYKTLMELQEADLVPNSEPFTCFICMEEYAPGKGVTLKDCLHTFCRNCLVSTVQYSEDAEVKCPYFDETYSCQSVLQQREIKALVPQKIFEKHLAKSVKEAENKIENAFHCKTPDCKGWCIYEDNVNEFRCPVCKSTNCLTCQAIHTGIDCRQYQEKMKLTSETDADANKTRNMLNEMVEKGEAMVCPKCQVVLMKKWGCDWLRCSMCKTEICWVTRGFRWGPEGKGDTSGGCKCGVNGVKCHPKCNYCH